MISKEKFTELWNEYIEPHIESGRSVWECSPKLTEHLKNVSTARYTDDEIIQMVEDKEL